MARPLKPLFDEEEVNRFIKPTLVSRLEMCVSGGVLLHVKTSEEDFLRRVLVAEKLVLKLSQSQSPLEYKVLDDGLGFEEVVFSADLVKLGIVYKDLTSLLYQSKTQREQARRVILPRLKAFHDAFEPLGTHFPEFLGTQSLKAPGSIVREFGALHRGCFEDFQNRIRSEDVITKTKRLQTRSNRNRLQQMRYIDHLLADYERLYVVYLDLGYDVTQPYFGHRDWLKRYPIRKHFDLFMKERRHNPLWKDDLVGYLWKLSDGVERGLHYHLLLFYRGSEFENHLKDKEILLDKWINEVTEGVGAGFQPVLPGQQSFIPEGLIEHGASESYEKLIGFICYLNKLDHLIQLEVPKGVNVYGRGQIASR